MSKMSPFLILICNEELQSPLAEYVLVSMLFEISVYECWIKFGLYNISMGNSRMLIILLLSTMKYDL